MHYYEIYALDRNEHIVFVHNFEGLDDSSALAETKKHSHGTALEVWEGARFVARIAQAAQAVIG